ncbi:MAG: acyl-[acyl-carrier-protein] thioesterase [Spirochaetes bacterium]|nr:acyl-[acyl-carrier-protein] thioesterase [Spirochaetota bacterium]
MRFSLHNEYTAVTRFADLDTQRHVTSRTYEAFALEGRYRVLHALGYTQEKIQTEQIYLKSVSGYVKFYRQQFPGVELKVVTEAFPVKNGCIHWEQKILEASGELVCHLQLLTAPVREDKPFIIERKENSGKHPEIFYSDLPPWSGAGERIVSTFSTLYSERDFAGRYPVAALWRIFEEGRWAFADRVGLTYERIVAMDTTSFYMGSVANFFAEIPAGRTLQLMTWIERIDKIRYWFRQDVLLNGRVLLSMRDEQLIVSLKRARPQRATAEFLQYMGKYVEFQ